jgi:hypothetical protein
MALALPEGRRHISTSANFQSKPSLHGINNAIFDVIYSNKDQKMPIAGFFCFKAQKYRFHLIFTGIVINISKLFLLIYTDDA